MPGKFLQAAGNELLDTVIYVPALSYPTIPAGGIVSTTQTIVGLQPLDCISWTVLGLPAHLALENIYVSALNTITSTWSSDGSGISSGTVQALLEVVRVDGANLGVSVIPQTIS
jgi:hypothetical protein